MVRKISFVFLVSLLLTACHTYTPKPRAYIRLNIPEQAYQAFDSLGFPYRFEYSQSAELNFVEEEGEQYWLDIHYPALNSTIYLSYKAHPKLDSNIEGVLFFVDRHISKAGGIREIEICQKEKQNYGYLYEIKGKEVASTCQFYLTDSNRHFVRGALYINQAPNNDSLAPLVSFLKQDVNHLIATWNWKK